MEPKNIADEEILYRGVKRGSGLIQNGKPQPGLFIDPNGASVSRDGGRTEQDIIDFLARKIIDRKTKQTRIEGCVKLTAQDCRKAETFPNPCKNTDDPYHAEIHDSETVKQISLFKAIRLCDVCRII